MESAFAAWMEGSSTVASGGGGTAAVTATITAVMEPPATEPPAAVEEIFEDAVEEIFEDALEVPPAAVPRRDPREGDSEDSTCRDTASCNCHWCRQARRRDLGIRPSIAELCDEYGLDDEYGYYGTLTVLRSMGAISDDYWAELSRDWSDDSASESSPGAAAASASSSGEAAAPPPFEPLGLRYGSRALLDLL